MRNAWDWLDLPQEQQRSIHLRRIHNEIVRHVNSAAYGILEEYLVGSQPLAGNQIVRIRCACNVANVTRAAGATGKGWHVIGAEVTHPRAALPKEVDGAVDIAAQNEFVCWTSLELGDGNTLHELTILPIVRVEDLIRSPYSSDASPSPVRRKVFGATQQNGNPRASYNSSPSPPSYSPSTSSSRGASSSAEAAHTRASMALAASRLPSSCRDNNLSPPAQQLDDLLGRGVPEAHDQQLQRQPQPQPQHASPNTMMKQDKTSHPLHGMSDRPQPQQQPNFQQPQHGSPKTDRMTMEQGGYPMPHSTTQRDNAGRYEFPVELEQENPQPPVQENLHALSPAERRRLAAARRRSSVEIDIPSLPASPSGANGSKGLPPLSPRSPRVAPPPAPGDAESDIDLGSLVGSMAELKPPMDTIGSPPPSQRSNAPIAEVAGPMTPLEAASPTPGSPTNKNGISNRKAERLARRAADPSGPWEMVDQDENLEGSFAYEASASYEGDLYPPIPHIGSAMIRGEFKRRHSGTRGSSPRSVGDTESRASAVFVDPKAGTIAAATSSYQGSLYGADDRDEDFMSSAGAPPTIDDEDDTDAYLVKLQAKMKYLGNKLGIQPRQMPPPLTSSGPRGSQDPATAAKLRLFNQRRNSDGRRASALIRDTKREMEKAREVLLSARERSDQPVTSAPRTIEENPMVQQLSRAGEPPPLVSAEISGSDTEFHDVIVSPVQDPLEIAPAGTAAPPLELQSRTTATASSNSAAAGMVIASPSAHRQSPDHDTAVAVARLDHLEDRLVDVQARLDAAETPIKRLEKVSRNTEGQVELLNHRVDLVVKKMDALGQPDSLSPQHANHLQPQPQLSAGNTSATPAKSSTVPDADFEGYHSPPLVEVLDTTNTRSRSVSPSPEKTYDAPTAAAVSPSPAQPQPTPMSPVGLARGFVVKTAPQRQR